MTAPGDPVGDSLNGGNGQRHVSACVDGEVDRITCGDGNRDRVFADQFDVITDASASDATGSCERVTRRSTRAARPLGTRTGPSPREEDSKEK